MKPVAKNSKIFSTIIVVSYLVFFTSLVFSYRALASISIGLILVAGISKHRMEAGSFFQKKLNGPFVVGCILFFLLQLIALLYTSNIDKEWDHIRIKSGLVFIPLAVLYTIGMDIPVKRRLFTAFCIILSIGSLYCLLIGLLNYLETNDISFLFYHELVNPLSHNAVQFSLLVFMALIYLLGFLKNEEYFLNKRLRVAIVIFLSIFILLLSSKLVIVIYLFYLIYYIVRTIKYKKARLATPVILSILIIGIGALFFTRNPVSKRFNEIINGDMSLVKQENFDASIYFNGVQFRLIQFRFTKEILNENGSWLTGVSPGDAQTLLDQKYISKNMYIGDPVRKDRGFLGYNTHNQFLESLLQNGIIGLVCFVFICFGLLKIVWRRKSTALFFISLLLIVYSLTESVFETQWGILIFTFFPLFLDSIWSQNDKVTKPKKTDSLFKA